MAFYLTHRHCYFPLNFVMHRSMKMMMREMIFFICNDIALLSVHPSCIGMHQKGDEWYTYEWKIHWVSIYIPTSLRMTETDGKVLFLNGCRILWYMTACFLATHRSFTLINWLSLIRFFHLLGDTPLFEWNQDSQHFHSEKFAFLLQFPFSTKKVQHLWCYHDDRHYMFGLRNKRRD